MCLTVRRSCPSCKKDTLAITRCLGGNAQWTPANNGGFHVTKCSMTNDYPVILGDIANIPCSDVCRDAQIRLHESNGQNIRPRFLPSAFPDSRLVRKEAIQRAENYERFGGAIDNNPVFTKVNDEFVFYEMIWHVPPEISAFADRRTPGKNWM